MTPFPLPLEELFGHWGSYVVYVLIGFGFGAVLEMSGFAISTKLAAQFYFKDLTVLKVMFTGIIVAMLGVFLASALGLLDYNLVWVNPTYVWPGIVGGLLMGVGFIIGGFCPGTSLVSAATLKVDGIIFAAGAFFGIFLFGETAPLFDTFWHSSYLGRLTIQDWLSVDTGVIVFVVVVMAVIVFALSEVAERYIGGMDAAMFPKWRYGAAFGVIAVAAVVMVLGQPTNADKWARIADTQEARLANREVQIHAGELLSLQQDRQLVVRLVDVRSEADYNRFHLEEAVNVPFADIPAYTQELLLEVPSPVIVLMSNDETAATEAWKYLVAESVPNTYILEGGINAWITTFTPAEELPATANQPLEDTFNYLFTQALGARHVAASPNADLFALEYTSKVVLQNKRGATGGGCG